MAVALVCNVLSIVEIGAVTCCLIGKNKVQRLIWCTLIISFSYEHTVKIYIQIIVMDAGEY